MEKKSLKIVLSSLITLIYMFTSEFSGRDNGKREGILQMTEHECKFRCTVLEKYKMTHMEIE